ncbi:ABC transporter substrate-binding protein [Acidocella sp. KAb 2-4]|uniref:ABC transporter substrate-binding protein n=1 Tax=Acidocella sp. KAb 2-4 TaxID=2885158 RepID=UPI001D06A0DB|nr:ABC transporter substrate-binding protein [Acidocella sp. KAb 2-4]MCB5943421.1 ABC transporter substrate-binding protein [Acidocella sp. KAb 2-4]
MKALLTTPLLALGLALAPLAQAATPEATPVDTLDAGLIAGMKAGSAGQGFQARYDALVPIVRKAYDLQEVTKNSVGFLWSTLPAAQQEELNKLFEQFTVASYVSQFNAFNGQSFKLLPDEKALGAKKIIETQLLPGDGGDPVELDYVVANSGAGWQINDVLLGGTISQVAVHASDFASLVKSGDASALIQALKSKIAALQSGSAGQ